MPPNPPANPQGAASHVTGTILVGPDGNEILTAGVSEYMLKTPSGWQTRKIYETVLLVCGKYWAPHQMNEEPIGCCFQCRTDQPPSHGLIRLSMSKSCVGCNAGAMCSKHRVLCGDGEYRCIRCARKYRWSSILKRIFYKEVRE